MNLVPISRNNPRLPYSDVTLRKLHKKGFYLGAFVRTDTCLKLDLDAWQTLEAERKERRAKQKAEAYERRRQRMKSKVHYDHIRACQKVFVLCPMSLATATMSFDCMVRTCKARRGSSAFMACRKDCEYAACFDRGEMPVFNEVRA